MLALKLRCIRLLTVTGRFVLFINGPRPIRSVREPRIPVPYVREYFRHDRTRVRMLFAAHRNDTMFVQALTDELTDRLGSVSRALLYPAGVLDAGERAVADEQIAVGRALPSVVTLSFAADRPTASHGFDAVMFASQPVAVHLLTDALRDADSRRALGTALEHPAGRRYAAQIGATAPSDDALVQRAALLLVQRSLVLLPRDLSRRQLRLAWLEHRVPSMMKVADAPGSVTPMRVVAPSLQPSGPMSVLPDPSDELSLQAQTLIEAAKNGMPFCEECARRAAEMAGV